MNYGVPLKVLESACFTIHLDVSQRSYIIVFVPARTFSSHSLASDVIQSGVNSPCSLVICLPLTSQVSGLNSKTDTYSRVFLQSLTVNTLTSSHIHLESLIPSQRISMLIYETG
ncbi:hypothetical protein M422DRAFT_56766 [Sphaerobolus stellatus SS14]|uniref:Uncharacterized protein n=1 Tax=Sphaerobolus stellatus (strain SS14) TaxID=990650 RepID=A0A0C9UDT7_SPHS4|nr:hypothetical protein M422DRAFT_56766 [Sphaerobolus stellatus SS14]